LVLFVYSLGGILLSLTAAVSLAFLGVSAVLMRDSANAQSAQWSAAGMLALAIAAIPALVESGRAIFSGQTSPPTTPDRTWYWLALLFPMGLLFGFLGYEQQILSGVLGPLGQLLAVATPVAFIAILLRRAGPRLSPRRLWGHFLAGLFAIPFVTIVIEGVVLILGLGLAALGLYLSPGGQQLIEELMPYLNGAAIPPTQIPESLIMDIVLNPIVIISLALFLGVLVPLIEETLKSTSVWPFLPGKVSPDKAFLGGALGGAGFALAEAMFLTQPATGWLLTAVARSGASSMHALASGLAGWGFAQGFVNKKWLKGLAAVAGAVALHGLWNLAAIGVSLGSASQISQPDNRLISILIVVSISIIVALSLLALFLLPTLQRRFRQQAEDEAAL
jgi:hypothetical protein